MFLPKDIDEFAKAHSSISKGGLEGLKLKTEKFIRRQQQTLIHARDSEA